MNHQCCCPLLHFPPARDFPCGIVSDIVQLNEGSPMPDEGKSPLKTLTLLVLTVLARLWLMIGCRKMYAQIVVKTWLLLLRMLLLLLLIGVRLWWRGIIVTIVTGRDSRFNGGIVVVGREMRGRRVSR